MTPVGGPSVPFMPRSFEVSRWSCIQSWLGGPCKYIHVYTCITFMRDCSQVSMQKLPYLHALAYVCMYSLPGAPVLLELSLSPLFFFGT